MKKNISTTGNTKKNMLEKKLLLLLGRVKVMQKNGSLNSIKVKLRTITNFCSRTFRLLSIRDNLIAYEAKVRTLIQKNTTLITQYSRLASGLAVTTCNVTLLIFTVYVREGIDDIKSTSEAMI